jgi:hypothetical protein
MSKLAWKLLTKKRAGVTQGLPPGNLNAVLPAASTTLDLYQKMLALHPNRVNPGSLWATAKALRPE